MGIDRDPEGPSLRQQFAIASTKDLDEALKSYARRFPDPRAKNDLVSEADGRFVIDLVPEHDPGDFIARGHRGGGVPMRGRDLLDPADVNGVVDMVLLVDVRGLDGHRHLEGLGRSFGVHD